MLKREGRDFATGEARFADRHGSPETKIYVRFRLGDQLDELTAQLDTGATYSIIRPDLAEIAGLPTDGLADITISTRLGDYRGRLVRCPVTLVADLGEDLHFEATVWVSDDWSGSNFLGYSGLLERIRFAVDPSTNRFYFGSVDAES